MTDEINREELIAEANTFALDFPSNVKTLKLQNMVDEAKGIVSKPTSVVVDKLKKPLTFRQKIIAKKKAAFETRVVTITNKDAREADQVTTAHLSFENNFFGLGKNVPLDIPVQLEVSLIKIAKAAMMTLHKAEIKNGKATGNKVPVRVAKYAISYGE